MDHYVHLQVLEIESSIDKLTGCKRPKHSSASPKRKSLLPSSQNLYLLFHRWQKVTVPEGKKLHLNRCFTPWLKLNQKSLEQWKKCRGFQYSHFGGKCRDHDLENGLNSTKLLRLRRPRSSKRRNQPPVL